LETKLVLIDADGHIRGYYNASDLEETNRLMAEIKILDYEKKRK
jgi:protein SCO1/2